ncbi:MAG: RusA family crossover junction endodeoxyribonuclease [Gemmatimonadota bacterium]|nr:RusA family crossover junction endodeoxyribonuclease [Gemmatimonadota bacterium]MDH3291587.1 RusA family crossover junction endodeoxyribonuclease [Gemmatimonadota bacterium]MDH3366490.1 RusA family crossover junction endodeoxyribonuclease [Gemmatimonadota bacterium]MDH3478879.1 RusA family crossover junction endodeoxyribonuclease [Gemmatimonadota bacterium]MDH3570983.1 RusA family crossover junction endodeoxyribonuclease [Gemmatimonadota bacterium]
MTAHMTDTTIQLKVYGRPVPAGSKRGFPIRGKGGKIHVSVTDASSKAKPWQAQVRAEAAELMAGRPLIRDPIQARAMFYLARPKGHFGKRGLRPSAPRYPAVQPDASKLWRAVEDALQGVVYANDAQIVEQWVMKVYGEPERCEIYLTVRATEILR